MRSFIKKALFIIFAAGLYCVLDHFDGISTSLERVQITYTQPFIVWVTVLSGPLIGGITSGVGELLLQIVYQAWDWTMLICTILNCVIIGLFTRKISVNRGFFSRTDFTYFLKVQSISNFITWQILYTVLNVWINKDAFSIVSERGFWVALNNSISCMMLTSLFLALYSKSRMTAANFYRG